MPETQRIFQGTGRDYQALCGMFRYEPKKEGGRVRIQVCVSRGLRSGGTREGCEEETQH